MWGARAEASQDGGGSQDDESNQGDVMNPVEVERRKMRKMRES
jgi:hypothetical protein